MMILIRYYPETLTMISTKLVFNIEKGVVKIFSEEKYYILGFKHIMWMEYSSARNCWNIDIDCPLPIGEINA